MDTKTFTLKYEDPNDPTQNVTIVVTATQNGDNVDIVAAVTEGEADLKALFIDCGPDEGGLLGASGVRSWDVPNYANMQGTGQTFDKVFTPDDLKPGYSGVTEIEGTLTGKTLDDILSVGVRAMSTGDDREGSVKLTGGPDEPPPPPECDAFPEISNISNIVLYFDAEDNILTDYDVKGNPAPDGFFTFKVDGVESKITDLDDVLDEILAYIADDLDGPGGIEADDLAALFLGAHFKFGTNVEFYDSCQSGNGDSGMVDDFPGGSEITDRNIDREADYADVFA